MRVLWLSELLFRHDSYEASAGGSSAEQSVRWNRMRWLEALSTDQRPHPSDAIPKQTQPNQLQIARNRIIAPTTNRTWIPRPQLLLDIENRMQRLRDNRYIVT